jgi:hypothetical protein
MKANFSVLVKQFQVLEEIDGAWHHDDFIALLDAMDYGDTSDLAAADAREMCLLSLQELEPEAAAGLLLKYRCGSRLNAGQIQNIANEMPEEKMWEEYADMSLHEQMFAVGSLLFQAFPRVFPEPDAVQVDLQVTSLSDAGRGLLEVALSEACVVRLLAAGMDEHAVLHRLFEDQLRGKRFPEADTIVWIVRQTDGEDSTAALSVISSGYWLDSLRETRSYECNAYPDED